MKKILVLFGGNSFEYEISCKSAKTILDNIDRSLYDVESVGITKDNNWYIFNDNTNLLLNNTWTTSNITKIDNIIEYLKSFDKVFPIMHGNPEENGNIQGLLNMFNIPFVGTDLLGSIISYDKELTYLVCKDYNIPEIPYFVIRDNKPIKKINLDFPVIIKPAKCGSSIGVNIANNIKELNKYIKEAFQYDNKIIVEKFIKCKELECAILKDNNQLKVSPVGEIRAVNLFYDYEAKYYKESELYIPASISEELTTKIQELSLTIFKVLELSNLSIIDFLYDYENDKIYFNEVNTMPSFTSISMYPLLFNNYGINTKDLITKLIET